MSSEYFLSCTLCKEATRLARFTFSGADVAKEREGAIPEFILRHSHIEALRVVHESDLDDDEAIKVVTT